MKTLRSEARKLGGPLFSVRNGHCSTTAAWEAGFARGLGEYGDYRVGRFVIHDGFGDPYANGRIHLHPEGGDFSEATAIFLGESGDTVKLILPPEEKEEGGLTKRVLVDMLVCAAEQATEANARIDRLEKVLREIAQHGGRLRDTWQARTEKMRRMATEALGDE